MSSKPETYVPPAMGGEDTRRRAAWVRRLNLTKIYARETLGPLLRRGVDIVAGVTGMVAAAPILAVAAAAVKATSAGPVFFQQTRVGQYGKLFSLYKIRTMYIDAEARLASLTAQNESKGGVTFKIKKDPRITPVGRILRKLSIDEFPQFWNLVNGTMTLFGPRPPVPREVAKYDAKARRRLESKPGLTCFWQVQGRSDLSFDEQVKLDVSYVDTATWLDDVQILVKTIPAVVFGVGAY